MHSKNIELNYIETEIVAGGSTISKDILNRLDTATAIAISGFAVLFTPPNLGLGYRALINMSALATSYIIVPVISSVIRPAPLDEKEIITSCV